MDGRMRPPTKETRRKISEALRGRTTSPEHREKISRANKGRKLPPRTEEHCRKLSASHRGEVYKRIGDARRGREFPKLSAALSAASTPVSEGEVCDICNRKFKRLLKDHDHKTGQSRGQLCNLCNAALGLFGDSIQVLEVAISYLKKYQN